MSITDFKTDKSAKKKKGVKNMTTESVIIEQITDQDKSVNQMQTPIVYGSSESTTIRNTCPCTTCGHNGHLTCVLKQPCDID